MPKSACGKMPRFRKTKGMPKSACGKMPKAPAARCLGFIIESDRNDIDVGELIRKPALSLRDAAQGGRFVYVPTTTTIAVHLTNQTRNVFCFFCFFHTHARNHTENIKTLNCGPGPGPGTAKQIQKHGPIGHLRGAKSKKTNRNGIGAGAFRAVAAASTGNGMKQSLKPKLWE